MFEARRSSLRLRHGVRWCGATIGMGTALVAGAASARSTPDGLRALAAADLRLSTIGYRLATSNTDRCTSPVKMTGLVLHELSEYAASERSGVQRTFGLGEGVGVLGVVPGSTAEAATLQAGDEIVAIAGDDVRVPAQGLRAGASYDRLAAIVDRLEAGLRDGPIALRVRRGEAMLDLSLTGADGCGGRTVLAPSRKLNAWSDGRYVIVTTRLLAAAANDSEVAFVVSHEMSHNNLRHQERLATALNGLFSAFGRGAARVKEAEIEADTAAIGLMQAAGYKLTASVEFLAHIRRPSPIEIATTHPRVGRRIQLVKAAVEAASRTEVATLPTPMTPVAPANGASWPMIGMLPGRGASAPLWDARWSPVVPTPPLAGPDWRLAALLGTPAGIGAASPWTADYRRVAGSVAIDPPGPLPSGEAILASLAGRYLLNPTALREAADLQRFEMLRPSPAGL